MNQRLRTKLIVSYTATALICVLLIGIFANMQLEKHFQEYVQNNQEKKNQEIVNLISATLKRGDHMAYQSIEDVGVYALEQGLIIQVWDDKGNNLWDAYTYNNGMCQSITMSISENMMSHLPSGEGELMTKDFDIMAGDVVIGKVSISYYGPFFYSESDMLFIRTLNTIFVGVGLFSLFLAVGFGAWMAKRLSTPITHVIMAAQAISNGQYASRVTEKTTTLEIKELTETVNELALSLENQEKLRRRLTGDVAHELRTPMATLQSHMEAMIDGIWAPTTDRLVSCHEEITRITRLVSDLERLAYYESEQLVLDKVTFSGTEFFEHLKQQYEPLFHQQGVKLFIESDGGELLADKDKLSQVLINLISNALKFTATGGAVTLKSMSTQTHNIIEVSDTGLGIAPEDLRYIFERFYRADVSRNRETGGAGIGLALVKAIVEAHQGTVEVASQLQVGTTFTIRMPK